MLIKNAAILSPDCPISMARYLQSDDSSRTRIFQLGTAQRSTNLSGPAYFRVS